MARKRMVDPNIWQSEDFSKLSTLAKLVFIGLFSLADDEGRGRANPTYLKSSLFPYNEDLRSTDIEKTLLEISSNMSVIFYSCNGSNYYELLSWDVFQKIDRPTPSQIPEFDENKEDIRRIFDEPSTSNRRVIAPNRIEENKNKKEEKRSKTPSFDEIKEYVKEKGLNVNPQQFYDYFTEGDWIDSKGNKVKNWKQKLLTWSKYGTNKQATKQTNYNNYEQREYNDLDKLYANKGG